MKENFSKIYIFLVLTVSFLAKAAAAQAFCPVCTVAVGAGVGLSRWLGVDDTITGIWIGGLLVSLSVWTIDWLQVRKISFYAQRTLVVLGYYVLVVAPLWMTDLVGHPQNKLWGVDKLVLGIACGSVVFLLGGYMHFYLKKKNAGRVFFPFQKVVIPVTSLILLNAVFYFVIIH